MPHAASFVLLFTIATGVAISVRRLRAPYTVTLVLVGLLLGSLRLVDAPHLTKDLLFALILPGLLFEAAFNLDIREIRKLQRTIATLAVPGVIAAIALTAAIITPIMAALGLDPTFDWRYGLVFGGVIAATDPIAVVSLFKQLRVGHRLTTLVEAESLLNDGTSVVFFSLILAYVSGSGVSAVSLLAQFALIVGGGVLVGSGIGFLTTQITKRLDDPMIELTLTVIAAYGSFAVAEQFHLSGVIATVSAGMYWGTVGWHTGMSPSTQLAVESFWDYLAFALNSFVFLLIGFEVEPRMLVASWAIIGVGFVGSLVARFAVIAVTSLLFRPTSERMPASWTAVLTWGGLRGALSMVLALSIPARFPHRDQLVAMTFGVVLLSLVVQGVSMSRLLRRLGLVPENVDTTDLDRARLELRRVARSIEELGEMRRQHVARPEVLDAIEQALDARRTGARGQIDALHLASDELRRDETMRNVRRLLIAEKAELAMAATSESSSGDVARAMIGQVDATLARLEAGDFEDAVQLLGEQQPAGARRR